jgi:signal transduction histidine kinase
MPVLVGRECALIDVRKGLGLGLYIVQQIVQAHGGRMEARSSETEGTVFVLELPRAAPPARLGAP